MAQNDETLQFVTGLKVLTNGNGEEELWLLTNRFQVRVILLAGGTPVSEMATVDNDDGGCDCQSVYFQKVMTGTLSTAEPNFRIFAVRILDLLGGTRCTGTSTNNFQFPRY